MDAEYSSEYYAIRRQGALDSARVIVPLVLDLFQVKSVLDVGCGTGEWLQAFIEADIRDVVGVDQAAALTATSRLVPKSCVREADLEQPLDLDRTFDAVVCVEVAEHIDREFADRLVKSLITHSSLIIFSAAIPGQGGNGHVNEQWPAYWAKKFAKYDFKAVDCFRDNLWMAKEVKWWYAQNLVAYISTNTALPIFSPRPYQRLNFGPEPRVHPRVYLPTSLNDVID